MVSFVCFAGFVWVLFVVWFWLFGCRFFVLLVFVVLLLLWFLVVVLFGFF